MSPFTNLAGFLTMWWVGLYTRGLPSEVRNDRLDELRSDIWDSTHDPSSSRDASTKTAWRLFSRTVFGMPQDIVWRVEAGRSSGVGNSELAKVGIGVGMVALLLLAAIIGPIFAPYEPLSADNMARLAAPDGRHLLGTNHEGRDVLSRLLFALHLNIIGGLLFALPAIVLYRLLIGIRAKLAPGWRGMAPAPFWRSRSWTVRFWITFFAGLASLLPGTLLAAIAGDQDLFGIAGKPVFPEVGLIAVTLSLAP